MIIDNFKELNEESFKLIIANESLNDDKTIANKKIDKAAKNGLVHKNKAARDKSKLNKAINTIK